jgi:hypothetical protein
MLDSQRWRFVEAVPAILFSVEGQSAVRGRRNRGWLTVAEGLVDDVGEHQLVLDDDVTLAFVLPPRIDLRPLRGTHVKLALDDEPPGAGPRAQMLTVADLGGHTRLIARFGQAGRSHALGAMRVRTALSQRPDGPMAFGTDQLQYVVHVGQHVRVREPAGEFVMHFVARTSFDYVAYVIADAALWSRRRA